jgi:hypothetical protein
MKYHKYKFRWTPQAIESFKQKNGGVIPEGLPTEDSVDTITGCLGDDHESCKAQTHNDLEAAGGQLLWFNLIPYDHR